MEAHQYKIRVERSKQVKNVLFNDLVPSNPDLSKAVVRKISYNTAKSIILEYEWLGTMANTTHHYGIFFGQALGGVVCFGSNCVACDKAERHFKVKKESLWFLARGACVHWTPVGSASKLIAIALKLLKKECPEVKVVLAYSDVDAGEIGTVYQATNWLYIGYATKPTINFYNPKTGRKFDERVLDIQKKKFGISRNEVREKLAKQGYVIQPKALKHRYCFLLCDSKEREDMLKHLKTYPYPKRNTAVVV